MKKVDLSKIDILVIECICLVNERIFLVYFRFFIVFFSFGFVIIKINVFQEIIDIGYFFLVIVFILFFDWIDLVFLCEKKSEEIFLYGCGRLGLFVCV